MNSLSMFKGATNPLLAYLESVSKGYAVPAGVKVEVKACETGCAISITLPNQKCIIGVNPKNIVTVNRLENLNAYIKEREAHYPIDSIEVAKNMIGLLSGICYEFGCESYRDADTTVKLIYHYLAFNIEAMTAVVS